MESASKVCGSVCLGECESLGVDMLQVYKTKKDSATLQYHNAIIITYRFFSQIFLKQQKRHRNTATPQGSIKTRPENPLFSTYIKQKTQGKSLCFCAFSRDTMTGGEIRIKPVITGLFYYFRLPMNL